MIPPKSRLEIDFVRLLNRCEQDIASQTLTAKNWRLEKYIEGLEDRLAELSRLTTCQPSREKLSLYRRKTRLLKGLLEAEKLNDASERLVAAQILAPRATALVDSLGNQQKDRSRDIFIKTRAKFTNDVRDELMPRKRTTNSESQNTELVLKYHHDMQEKVAAEMVSMAHNLKENLTIANEIIRKDVEVLEGTSSHADTSLSGLKQNTDRLSEFTARACQYWLWISLALVSLSFLYMVLFIRMFPKRG